MDDAMPESPDVFGIGTLAMDVIKRVDRLPEADGFCLVRSTQTQPGGSCTNVLTQLARLGARCAFQGAVGDDKLGQAVHDSLVGEGIDAERLAVRPGQTTLHTTVLVDDAGQRAILLEIGDAFGSLASVEVDREAIRSSRLLYTDLMPKDACMTALTCAYEVGVPTIINLQVDLDTMRSFGWDATQLWQALALADVIAPCRTACRDLFGSDEPDEIARAIRRRCPHAAVILTRGAEGALAYPGPADADEGAGLPHPEFAPAQPAAVVDTTGAGDSFLGGFALAWLRARDRGVNERAALRAGLDLGSACAGKTVAGLGARACPTREQLGMR